MIPQQFGSLKVVVLSYFCLRNMSSALFAIQGHIIYNKIKGCTRNIAIHT